MNGSFSEEINELMQEYQLPLTRYVTGILHDPETARDIVQDSFIRYLKYRSGNKTIDNPKAWLYRVAHNLALDYYRKHGRVDGLDDEAQRNLADSRQRSPAEKLERSDAEEAAWRALEILNERDRDIVLLKVIHHMSYKEIARTQNLTIANVGFILHNSLKRLARELKKELN